MKMKAMLKKNDVKKLMLAFGFVSAAPIFTFMSVSIYTLLLLIIGLCCIIFQIRNGLYIRKRGNHVLTVYFLWVSISYLVCAMRMPKLWTSDLLTSFVQLLAVFFIYFTFDYKSETNIAYKSAFIKGVYYSSIVQMFWSYLQLGGNLINVDVNSLVFKNFLHMSVTETTQFSDYGIKLSGFCWNSANLAPLMVFGYLYAKNSRVKALFLLISLLSNSKTLMFGMAICFVLNIVLPRLKTLKIKKNSMIRAVGVVVLLSLFICVFWTDFRSWFNKVASLLNVIDNVSKEPSTYTHFKYLSTVPEILKRNDVISNVFGFGPGCSGYTFSTYFNQYNGIKWSIECDYVNILWQYGIVGFFLYYLWLARNIIKVGRMDLKYIVLFITYLIMGFMYNITFNWVYLLILFIFSLGHNEYNIFAYSTEER